MNRAAGEAAPTAVNPPEPSAALEPNGQAVVFLAVSDIQPNAYQPRQHFAEDALNELAESIRYAGVMQPIIVRPADQGFELVAGERRWRAAQLAELTEIPAIVRDLDDGQIAEWALIENLQREDLNPIERAQAFRRLIDQFDLNHDEVAGRVGVERSTITNTLRLLNLADEVQIHVVQGRLSAGQARALAGLPDLEQQLLMAKQAISQAWSVRKVEAAVRRALKGTEPATPSSGRGAHLHDLEEQIGRQLGTKVTVRSGRKKGTGTLSIDFYSLEQFDALLTRLDVNTEM